MVCSFMWLWLRSKKLFTMKTATSEYVSVFNKCLNSNMIKLDWFDNTSYTHWKDKISIFLIELGVAYLMSPTMLIIPWPFYKDIDKIRAQCRKHEDDEIHCKGFILNTLFDQLYDLYQSMQSPQKIRIALEK